MSKPPPNGQRRQNERANPVFGAPAQLTPKLIDVAHAAGVSLATASRALSAPDQVRAETRDRVIEAANELGYLAHGAARALASQRTRTIGAIFPPVDNPVFASGTHALAKTLSSAGYTLLLATHDYDRKEELSAARRLMERGVDGLVLVGQDHDPVLMQLLEKTGMPFELTWSLDAEEKCFSIGIDHVAAAAEITQYLIDLGHQKFGVIAGQIDRNDRAAARLRGVRQTLAAAELALPESLVRQTSFTITHGRQVMAELLASGERFTAVLCSNDLLAMGAVLEAESQGIAVPEQMSIVGFDDIEFAAQLKPSITTMRVPSADIGRQAGQRMLARLAGEPVAICESLQSILIKRESAGPAPK
ncbi:MAG: LacI family DNA-binding transcriptional regulator [Burkholderiaceae bacterium]